MKVVPRGQTLGTIFSYIFGKGCFTLKKIKSFKIDCRGKRYEQENKTDTRFVL